MSGRRLAARRWRGAAAGMAALLLPCAGQAQRFGGQHFEGWYGFYDDPPQVQAFVPPVLYVPPPVLVAPRPAVHRAPPVRTPAVRTLAASAPVTLAAAAPPPVIVLPPPGVLAAMAPPPVVAAPSAAVLLESPPVVVAARSASRHILCPALRPALRTFVAVVPPPAVVVEPPLYAGGYGYRWEGWPGSAGRRYPGFRGGWRDEFGQ